MHKTQTKILLFFFILNTLYLILFTFAFAQPASQSTFQLPPGEPITYSRVNSILDNLAKFLYTIGITLGVITLVVSGIMFFSAGSDTKAEKAKGWFRNGIIGTLVIFAVGVIIQTIKIIVEGRFF